MTFWTHLSLFPSHTQWPSHPECAVSSPFYAISGFYSDAHHLPLPTVPSCLSLSLIGISIAPCGNLYLTVCKQNYFLPLLCLQMSCYLLLVLYSLQITIIMYIYVPLIRLLDYEVRDFVLFFLQPQYLCFWHVV